MEIKRRNSSHKVNRINIVRDLGFLGFLAKKYLVCIAIVNDFYNFIGW